MPDAGSDAMPPAAAVAPMRRLTRAQYERSVRDLLGPALPEGFELGDGLPPDDRSGGFAANTVAITDPVLEQYEAVAERIADAVDPDALMVCCPEQAVDSLGPRFHRRPLTEDERVELVELGRRGTPTLVRALLLSPAFLYRAEVGTPIESDPKRLALDGESIATRLSYLVWGTTPDDALLAAGADGSLRDSDVRAAQLQRMLADPRARDGLAAMHRQWLELDPLESVVRDRNLYPGFTEAIGPFLLAELAGFVDAVVRHGDGRLATLLTSRTTFGGVGVRFWYDEDADVELEDPPPGFPEADDVLSLDPEHRAGILTLLPVLVAHAKAERSDPVARGALIRQRVLCGTLAAPPPDIPAPPSSPEPGASLREQLAQHREDPSCAACHELMDPIGFAFETFDAMGRRRSQDEAGNAIDDRGEVIGTDVAGTFDGAVALAEALAQSDDVHRCYATQWFRYAFGRLETPQDAEAVHALGDDFIANGGHIPSLLEALVTSEAFVHRRLQ